MPDFARREPDHPTGPGRRAGAPSPAPPLLALQRTVGNRAARSILARAPVEAGTERQAPTIAFADLGSIEVLSWSFGPSSGTSGVGGSGSGRGDSHHRDLVVSSPTGELSAKLMQAAASGRNLGSAVLTSGTTTITFEGVVIVSFSSITSQGENTDSWSFSYSSVEYKNASAKPDSGQ